MVHLPILLRVTVPLVLLALACGRAPAPGDDGSADAPELPVSGRPLTETDIVLVTRAGSSVRFRVVRDGSRRRVLTRVQEREAGRDSIVAIVDAETNAPIASYQRLYVENGDTATARLDYGRGFDGQARLTLSAGGRRQEQNLRTPAPALDAAQIPLTFSSLPFGDSDTLTFNFIAPFERRALPARLIVGARETIRLPDGPSEAYRVRFQVRGLEEHYWFSTEPPHLLLRWREVTRNRTWTRTSP